MAQTFCLVGKTAVALWALSMEHHEQELRCFAEPLRERLNMVHVAKVALV